MKIDVLVDRDYRSIDLQEDIFEVLEWLKETRYLVPIDENLEAVGILTIDDIHRHPDGKVIDCDLFKPRISSDHTITEVFSVMQEKDLHYLPVFDNNNFIGVISLFSITAAMAKQLMNGHINYQKVIHHIRSPVSNIKGMINTFNTENTEREKEEFLQLIIEKCKQVIDSLDESIY